MMIKLCATLVAVVTGFVGFPVAKHGGQPAQSCAAMGRPRPGSAKPDATALPDVTASPRARLMATAAGEIGTVERTGRNDGPVEKYLTAVGLKKGDPYCAAFVYWCGRQSLGAANPFPRSGWSPDFVSHPTWIRGRGTKPESGDTFGIYFASKGRVAHTGLVSAVRANSIITIEANTSPDASTGEAARNGNGVWRKIRPLATIHSTKRWLP